MEKLPERGDCSNTPDDEYRFQRIRQKVATILLGYTEQDIADKPRLSRREMAQLLDTSWELINKSLISLQTEDAIRLDRHRLFINVESLTAITKNKLANTK